LRLAIRRRYFIEEISPPSVPPSARPRANVVDHVDAVRHDDSLKDIPDDRLSGRANNGDDSSRGGKGEGQAEGGRKIPQPVICVECIIKIPRGRSASARTLVPRLPVLSRVPMILNYVGIAGRSVPRPRWYLLDRAKNHEYDSFQARYPRYQRRTRTPSEPRAREVRLAVART